MRCAKGGLGQEPGGDDPGGALPKKALEAEPVVFNLWRPRTVTARLRTYGIPSQGALLGQSWHVSRHGDATPSSRRPRSVLRRRVGTSLPDEQASESQANQDRHNSVEHVHGHYSANACFATNVAHF